MWIRNLIEAIRELTKEKKHMAKSLDNLTAAIGKLTTSVDAAVAKLGTPPTGVPEADVQAAADAVNAQSARLDTAVSPTPPPAS